MDDLIQFQRKSSKTKPSGEDVDLWINVGKPVWADVRSTGRERPENFQEDQFIARQRREFRIYWMPGINAKLRIWFIEEELPYDIQAVNPLGRREGLSIIAVARGDQ